MAYASRAGRAHTSSRRPRAFAVCDRCGIWYNHHQLSWQFDWAGVSLVNKRILVCLLCLDTPQQQLRAIVLPPDPLPIMNPRPEQSLVNYETDYRFTSELSDSRHGIPIPQGDLRITQGEARRITQRTGDRFYGAERLTSQGWVRVTHDGRPRTVENPRGPNG